MCGELKYIKDRIEKRHNLLVEKLGGERFYRIRGGKMPLFEIAAALLNRRSDM